MSGVRTAVEGARLGPTTPVPPGSTVVWPDGRRVYDPANGFVTGLAVRELRLTGRPVPRAWLDCLEACRRPDGFGFWPADGVPPWAPALPADADDTAVLLLELHLAGRVTRADARRTACFAVGRHRLDRVPDPGPPWLRRGMFVTWLRAGPGIVDLAAVVNTLALLHALDLTRIPGVTASLAAVDAAVAWAGSSALRWTSLTPFYPEPDELARALAHAATWGVPGAAGAARTCRAVAPRRTDAVCSMAYGPPVWHSPGLAALRGSHV